MVSRAYGKLRDVTKNEEYRSRYIGDLYGFAIGYGCLYFHCRSC